MSTVRKTVMPLLERRAAEITRLRAELETAQARIVELEAALEAIESKSR